MGLFDLRNVVHTSSKSGSTARSATTVERRKKAWRVLGAYSSPTVRSRSTVPVPELDGAAAEGGGFARLQGRFRTMEMVGSASGLDSEMTVDAAGNPLPVTVRDASRCKAIFDEAGIVNVISSELKLEMAGGGALAGSFLRVQLLLCAASFVLIFLAVEYIEQGSFDGGLGDCLTEARSLQDPSLQDPPTVDISLADEICASHFSWNRYVIYPIYAVLALSLAARLLTPFSLMMKMNQLMARAEEPVRPSVLDRKFLDSSISLLRMVFVGFFNNSYGEKQRWC